MSDALLRIVTSCLPSCWVLRAACLAVLVLSVGGCASGSEVERTGSVQVSTAAPRLGACRALTPPDVARSSNASPVVDCARRHTAETFAVGSFPRRLSVGAEPDDDALGAFLHNRCRVRFQRFLGGDESLVLRTTVSWAWFRASRPAWAQGAHWWRCDVVGGGNNAEAFAPLPRTARGVLLGAPDDRWLVCADGPTVADSAKIPCTRRHTWRAVSTIVLGRRDNAYPGDRLVEVRTRDFCSGSVVAWMHYPVSYDYGYTWFHETEWQAGNRRSICWAKTSR